MRKVYLDNAATTPISSKVLKAMLPFLKDHYGNPQSLHDWGDEPREAIEKARGKVASLVCARPDEIIFTSSGTESNNLAIKGLAMAQQSKGNHIVVSSIEHFSVLHSALTLEKWGFQMTQVPVDKHGLVNPEEVARSIKDDTVLVSIMHANGEVGTIEPIAEISKVVKKRGVLFHTDAVAAAGSIPIDVRELGIDALSLAGNQFYGPKGAGALWIKKGTRIIPLLDGGVQEGGWRAGTENVPAIIGMGKAAELAKKEMGSRIEHLSELRDRLIKELPSQIERAVVTGHPTRRLPGNSSFIVEFIEGESMLMLLNHQGIAAASGSACTSRALKASHVLTAMGIPHEVVHGSLLFSFGMENTIEDVEYVLEVLPPIVDRLRQMSPLYAKYIKEQKGEK